MKSPIQDKPKEKHTKHILIKLTKTKHKERILKEVREKQQVTCKGNPIYLTADFSAETLQARREWQDIFKVLKGKNPQPRLLCPSRISFKIDGKIKSFSDKQKLREFSTPKPALQQMLKGLIGKKYSRRKKERVWEKFWRDYSWKFPQCRKENHQSSPKRHKEYHTG